ncbi:MAG: hypothetical protein HZR80_13310 [Candidatus Heimdallarchaeota archaeon]
MFGNYIRKLKDREYVFEFGRKMQCPHCKENVSWIKGYIGQDQGLKSLIGTKINIMVMVFLCPNCETILNAQQVGVGNKIFADLK